MGEETLVEEFRDQEWEETGKCPSNPKTRSWYRCCCGLLILFTATLLIAAAVLIPTVLIPKLHHKTQGIRGAKAIELACNATLFPQTCNSSLASYPSSLNSGAQGLTALSVASATYAVSTTLAVCSNMSQMIEVSSNATFLGVVNECFQLLDLALFRLEESYAKLNSTSLSNSAYDDLTSWLSGALTFYGSCSDGLALIQTINGVDIHGQTNYSFQVVSNALAFVNALASYREDLESWQPVYFLGNSRVSATAQSQPSGRRRLQSIDLQSTLTDVTSQSSQPHGNPHEFWANFSISRWLRSRPNLFHRNSDPTMRAASSQSPDSSLVDEGDLPKWLAPELRRVLEESDVEFNITVALDGSGSYGFVQQAVNAAPTNSSNRFVIYIKAGVYNENVNISKYTKNLMLMGDGINQTIITGNLSVQVVSSDGQLRTSQTATVGIFGDGFIAKGITFQNTAGAISQQAVALRVAAHQCAFWQCSMDGFQDTLYAQAHHQFYKDCTIYGTVDFVFGNAAAVFQSCTLFARANLPGKANTYTAQGRYAPHQHSGFSIQNCTIDGAPDLEQLDTKAFLGRPWKLYSQVVFMKSYISDIIDPSGWLAWNGSFALSTLFYGEYENTGPGANTEARVNWSTVITDPSVVAKFEVGELIYAAEWLQGSGIPYNDSL